MSNQNIGYKRVSSTGQSNERQLYDIVLDKTYEEKISGKYKSRPELDAMVNYMRAGDTLHVHSVDRLARNAEHLISLVSAINSKGVNIVFYAERIAVPSDSLEKYLPQLKKVGSFAQLERELINERAAEGRAIAKAKGVRFGRKPTLTKKQMVEVKQQRESGKPVAKIAIDFDVSRQAIYRALEA